MHKRPQPFGRGLVIICNFLSSSVGFNLCSCFFRLTPVVRFRFQPLWAVRSTTFAASLPLSDPLCFRVLSSASFRALTTQPLCFLSLPSRLRPTVASSVRPLRFRFLGFPRSFRPGFPCLLSRFFVLGFLFVSFHPSRFRSHSRSSGDPLSDLSSGADA